jgi:hypothetical protein
MMGKITT